MVLECSYLSSARDWNDIENSRRVVESEMSPVFDAYLELIGHLKDISTFIIQEIPNCLAKHSWVDSRKRLTESAMLVPHQQSRNSGRYRYSISTDMLKTYHYYRMYPRDGFPRLVTSIWVWDKKLGNFVESRMSSAVCLSQLVLPFDPRCSAPSLLDWDISESQIIPMAVATGFRDVWTSLQDQSVSPDFAFIKEDVVQKLNDIHSLWAERKSLPV
jgi:hypothetical protein